MSKLPPEHRFVDVSDYGRPVASWIVDRLLPTPVTSIHLTFAFLIAGVCAMYALYRELDLLAAFFLMAKNILDAADGEMARKRNAPSSTGRYLDSVFDFLVNLGLFFLLYLRTDASFVLFVAAFLCLEFQCSLFNFYYLVQRKLCSGDLTSRIDEFPAPEIYPPDNPKIVSVLHVAYLVIYGPQDRLMFWLDGTARYGRILPKWFMTVVSFMGLGFQLLLMALFLVLGRPEWIMPFFLIYMVFGFVIVLIRKWLTG